jgi:hypothetical protein
VDFIRADRNVKTGISRQQQQQQRLAANGGGSLGAWPSSSSRSAGAQRPAKQAGAPSKAGELPAGDRSDSIESLNRFLLERPRHGDKTAGAILGRQLALKQIDNRAPLPGLSAAATTTTATPSTAGPSQFDYLTRLYLDNSMQLEVRAHLGETAYLLCRLRANLQHADQLQVSWFRGVEILTSGEFRYTSDERFKPSHQAGSNDWLLELHNVRASDEGDYECQVNSTPRSASVRVRLVVIAASVEIVEGPELRVAEGEQVELTCRVQFSSQEQLRSSKRRQEEQQQQQQQQTAGELGGGQPRPDDAPPDAPDPDEDPTRRRRRHVHVSAASWQPYIYWYKDQVYLHDSRVQRQQRNLTGGGLENVLRVSRASRSDSGSYTCKLVPELTEVRPAQAQVIVATSGGGADSTAPPMVGLVLVLFVAAALVAQPVRPISL